MTRSRRFARSVPFRVVLGGAGLVALLAFVVAACDAPDFVSARDAGADATKAHDDAATQDSGTKVRDAAAMDAAGDGGRDAGVNLDGSHEVDSGTDAAKQIDSGHKCLFGGCQTAGDCVAPASECVESPTCAVGCCDYKVKASGTKCDGGDKGTVCDSKSVPPACVQCLGTDASTCPSVAVTGLQSPQCVMQVCSADTCMTQYNTGANCTLGASVTGKCSDAGICAPNTNH